MEARNWRFGGGDERLNMRTVMDCAWMLDGATKDRVYTLSLASRGQNSPSQIDSWSFRIDFNLGLESTPHSKFHEPPKIESIRWITEPIRFHPVFKINVHTALRIDSSTSELILKKRNMVSKGFQRLSDDDWSGYISCTGSSLESWRSIREDIRVSSFLQRSSLPLHVLEN
ncbi:hypothetical protein PIB30_034483 [Stylosanthes scabra]|uniref:Uncharacterized protein n=1 Tax=Stylosanthes scabra TaxID=79078 RepID=A0ABU6WDT0_9FABA|nr:hypothetical protein [Stylosanthes scabra]